MQTQRCGEALDLVFYTQVSSKSTIQSNLHTKSDHETLILTIALAGPNIGGFFLTEREVHK